MTHHVILQRPDHLLVDPVFCCLFAQGNFLKATVSQTVLIEAQRNIQNKLGDETIKRFFNLLTVVPFSLASLPEKTELKKLEKIVNKKDVHVLAAALAVRASFLLTLDKGLVLEVNRARLTIQAIMPGEFIKTILPTHEGYSPKKN